MSHRPDLSAEFIRRRIEGVAFFVATFLGYLFAHVLVALPLWAAAVILGSGAVAEIGRLAWRARQWSRWLDHASPEEFVEECQSIQRERAARNGAGR